MPEREITANIERAEDSIAAAATPFQQSFRDFAASRAYYAAFYAATALLLENGLAFRKHSGVLAAIHKLFIRTGKMEKSYGPDLNRLFELRAVGDYGEIRHVPREDAEKAIQAAEAFLNQVKSINGKSA